MSGAQFPNEVAPGGVLIVPSIHSPGYVTDVSGWSVNQDGTAQFNGISLEGGTISGPDWTLDDSGLFMYGYNASPGYTPAQVGFGAGMASYTMATISAMETGIGRHLDLLVDWKNWDASTGWPVPSYLSSIGNRSLVWTIQPTADVNWQDLIAGDYDAQIIAFANWVNENYTAAPTMYVRFAHEMNGTGWYPWQVGGACGVTSAANYAAGFNHVASVLKAHSGKILMVWCACGGYTNLASFYDSSADIIAFDGYNCNSADAWYTDTACLGSPSQAPGWDPYDQCCALDPVKPIWITEVACEDTAAFTYNSVVYGPFTGVTKSGWVETFFSSTAYPRLAAVVWFNIVKERNWVWNSSADSQTGFTTAFAAFTSSTGSAVWDPATGGFNPILVLSLSPASGVTFTGIPGVTTNTLTVTDASGDTLANIDASGNITGQTINAGIDVVAGGQSLTSYMNSAPAGVVARGWTPGSSQSQWPGTAISSTETAILELDFTAYAGRDYMLQVQSSEINMVTASTTGGQYIQRLRYTTDGSTPTTSSAELAGHSPAVTPLTTVSLVNFPTGYQEYLIPIPTANTEYRFLISSYCTGGGTFKYSNNLEMRVTDLGVNTGQFGNSGVVFGTGTSGGGGSTQTYTETFYGTGSWSYRTDGGLRNTNGDMYQGAYSGEGGYQYSYIQFAQGSRGNNLNAVLNYTVNWVSLRLTNLHTWYSGGMTIGLHSSTSLGGAQGTYSSILNPGGWNISEGATYTWPNVPSAVWSPFKAGGTTYLVLSPDAGDLENLQWYGYFYGGDGSDSYMPLITVNYTH